MIRILSTRPIEGPNVWLSSSVTTAIATDAEASTIDLPLISKESSFHVAALVHFDSPVTPIEPLPTPALSDVGSLVSSLAIDLQRIAGFNVAFSFSRPDEAGRGFEVVVQNDHESVGIAALQLAAHLVNRIVAKQFSPEEFQHEFFQRFGTIALSRHFGRATGPIVAAARMRGVPLSRIDSFGRMLELGNGAFRRRVNGSITSLTPKNGDDIASDKSLTNRYLSAAGLPVPRGIAVRTVEQARKAAAEIGYPVVLKPSSYGGSRGVFVDLRDDDEVVSRFPESLTFARSGIVIVEEQAKGNEYRVLVVNAQLVAAQLRTPPEVVGDGQRTIRALIDELNEDPRRGPQTFHPLKFVTIDDDLILYLRRQVLVLDSVPLDGRRVWLRASANVHTGGMTTDVRDMVHPDNVEIFRQVARVLELDVASIDVFAEDLAKSIWETSGSILDVNTGSGFVFELNPAEGKPRDPGAAIVEMLFPEGARVRVPIIAVAGDDATEICRLIAEMLRANGERVSTATRDGIEIDGTRIRKGDFANPTGFGIALNNPATGFLVAEVDPGVITETGLGFGYCDMAVVTSLSGLVTPFGLPIERVFTQLCEAGSTLILNERVDEAGLRASDSAATVIPYGIAEPSAGSIGTIPAVAKHSPTSPAVAAALAVAKALGLSTSAIGSEL